MTSQRPRRPSRCRSRQHSSPQFLLPRLLRPPPQSMRMLRQRRRPCLRSCRRFELGPARFTGTFVKSYSVCIKTCRTRPHWLVVSSCA